MAMIATNFSQDMLEFGIMGTINSFNDNQHEDSTIINIVMATYYTKKFRPGDEFTVNYHV